MLETLNVVYSSLEKGLNHGFFFACFGIAAAYFLLTNTPKTKNLTFAALFLAIFGIVHELIFDMLADGLEPINHSLNDVLYFTVILCPLLSCLIFFVNKSTEQVARSWWLWCYVLLSVGTICYQHGVLAGSNGRVTQSFDYQNGTIEVLTLDESSHVTYCTIASPWLMRREYLADHSIGESGADNVSIYPSGNQLRIICERSNGGEAYEYLLQKHGAKFDFISFDTLSLFMLGKLKTSPSLPCRRPN